MTNAKTELEVLSLDELEEVTGTYWVRRNGRWVWVQPRGGVNRPSRGGRSN